MRQRTAIISATVVSCLGAWLMGGGTTAEAQEKFTGCLKNNGKLVRVAPGENPTKPCKRKQTQIMFPGMETTDGLMEKDAGGVRFVFVSSTTYSADIRPTDCTNCSTGIERARFECNSLAAAVGLPGEYEPWLSAEDSNVVERFEALAAEGPWFNLKGDLVASSLRGLVTAKAGLTFLYNAIGYTEDLQPPPIHVWTGTSADGSTSGSAVTGSCGNWSSTQSYVGLVGQPDDPKPGWTELGTVNCAGSTAGLYCFQR